MNKIFNTADGRIDLFTFGNPNSKNRILITGCKHGGEVESLIISWKLVDMVAENSYDKSFIAIMPNLNYNQSKAALNDLMAGSVRRMKNLRDKYRRNLAGIDLNRDYPPPGTTDGRFVQAEQTKIVMDLHEEFGFNLVLDFHSHYYTPFSHYICDTPHTKRLASRLNDINGNGWILDVYQGARSLKGCASGHFTDAQHFITVELGACPYRRDFFRHCDIIWDGERRAMDWLFRQELENIK